MNLSVSLLQPAFQKQANGLNVFMKLSRVVLGREAPEPLFTVHCPCGTKKTTSGNFKQLQTTPTNKSSASLLEQHPSPLLYFAESLQSFEPEQSQRSLKQELPSPEIATH